MDLLIPMNEKIMKKLISIFIVLFLVFTTIIAGGLYFYFRPQPTISGEGEAGEAESPTFENLDVSNFKERVNVLLLGVDTLTTEKNQTGTRTDTIMVLSVDPVTKTGFILSIPRDSYVKISGTNEYTKINHAHSYGGSDLAIATVKEFIDLPIHHYMKVDYKALFKTVDDLGGVEFDVPQDMYYVDQRSTPPLNINLKKGLQLLDGEKAMQLIRFRKGYADQDLGRVRVQQDFIKAVLKKAYSPASIVKIPKFVETLYSYVETDMSISDIVALMKLGTSIDSSKIETATVPGVPSTRAGAGSVLIVDEAAFAEQLRYLVSGMYQVDEPDTNESPNGENVISTEQLNQYRIEILNGSGVAGEAKRATDILRAIEVSVDRAGNASSFDYESTIIYYKEDRNAAEYLKNVLKAGKIQQGTKSIVESEPDIVVMLGKDFSE